MEGGLETRMENRKARNLDPGQEIRMEGRLETNMGTRLERNLVAGVEENLEARVDIRMVPDRRAPPSPPRRTP